MCYINLLAVITQRHLQHLHKVPSLELSFWLPSCESMNALVVFEPSSSSIWLATSAFRLLNACLNSCMIWPISDLIPQYNCTTKSENFATFYKASHNSSCSTAMNKKLQNKLNLECSYTILTQKSHWNLHHDLKYKDWIGIWSQKAEATLH